MKTFRAILAASVLTGVLSPIGVGAQSLRCKGDLASVGDSKASVFQKCGEPVFKDSFCKPANEIVTPIRPALGGAVVNVLACENVEEWTYNPGYGQFMTTLRLEAGRLVSIKYGDRVK